MDKLERLATKQQVYQSEAILCRNEILMMYLQYAEWANNWDLVDLSAPKILGHWLMLPTLLGIDINPKENRSRGVAPSTEESQNYKRQVLDELAESLCLWKQRMSIVCTLYPSHHGDLSWCLRYAEIHLHHPHDLMHKEKSKCHHFQKGKRMRSIKMHRLRSM